MAVAVAIAIDAICKQRHANCLHNSLAIHNWNNVKCDMRRMSEQEKEKGREIEKSNKKNWRLEVNKKTKVK